jgi:hypothetical protein
MGGNGAPLSVWAEEASCASRRGERDKPSDDKVTIGGSTREVMTGPSAQ